MTHEGFIFLFVEWSRSLGDDKDKPRYVTSVNPEEKVYLRGLGDVLNIYEKQRRISKGIVLPGEPRVGYDIADPWYDGRGHTYTIVDNDGAPRVQFARHPDANHTFSRRVWRDWVADRTAEFLRRAVV